MTAARLTVYTADEIVAKLVKLGFVLRPRTATSHLRLVHSDGRKVTVPQHKGSDVGRGLLRKILPHAEISPDEFAKL